MDGWMDHMSSIGGWVDGGEEVGMRMHSLGKKAYLVWAVLAAGGRKKGGRGMEGSAEAQRCEGQQVCWLRK